MEWTSISWGLPDRWNPWNLGHWHRRGLRERDSSGRSQPHLGSHKGSCFLMQNLSEISQKKQQSLFAFFISESLIIGTLKKNLYSVGAILKIQKTRCDIFRVFFEVEDYACKNLGLWSWLSAMLIPRKLHVTTSLNSSTEGLYECNANCALLVCWFPSSKPTDDFYLSRWGSMAAWSYMKLIMPMQTWRVFLSFFFRCAHTAEKVVFPVDLQKISLGAPLDNTSLQVSSLGGCLRVPWIENKENPPGTRQH